MHTDFILQGKTFQFSEQSANFAHKYLERVRKYVASHNLGHEYYEDIETRFAEKIEEKKGNSEMFSESDLIRIVNELGEPEDIFADIGNSNTKSFGKGFLPKNGLHRNSANGIIFGVCAGLAESLSMDPLYLRILFVGLTFLGGSWVILYLALALLLKDVPRTHAMLEQENPNIFKNNILPPAKALHRNSAQGMIFGVAAGLGETFGIDAIYFRILFILLVLFFGTGILAYLLLAILLKDVPVKSLDENEKSTLSLSEGVVKDTLHGIPETMKNTFQGIPKVGNSLFSFVASVFFFFVFGFLGFLFAGFALAGIIGSSVLISWMNLGNQMLLPTMPHWFYAACLVAALLFSVFSVASFARAFGKKILSGYALLVLVGIMAISLTGVVSGGIGLISEYSFTQTHETAYPLTSQSGTVDLGMNIELNDYVGFHFAQDIVRVRLRLETVDSATGSIVVRETFHTKDEASQELLRRAITPIQIVETPGKINISLSGSTLFNAPVPFAFPERTVIVRIPKSLSLHLVDYEGNIGGIAHSELDRYVPGWWECAGTVIRYSDSQKQLQCDPMGYGTKVLKEAYARYIEDNIRHIIGDQERVYSGEVMEWKDDHTALVRYEQDGDTGSAANPATVFIAHDADGDIQAKMVQ